MNKLFEANFKTKKLHLKGKKKKRGNKNFLFFILGKYTKMEQTIYFYFCFYLINMKYIYLIFSKSSFQE